MQETKLQGGISLGLSLIFGLSNVHQLSKVMYGHLDIAVLSVDICQELMCLALLVSGTAFHLTLAHL